MITALDHIAIAVPDLDKAIKRFLDDFGFRKVPIRVEHRFAAGFAGQHDQAVLQVHRPGSFDGRARGIERESEFR